MMEKYELYSGYDIFFQTPDDGYSYFFGYYDKSPLNHDNSKLLSHRVAFDGREVTDGDWADIGYFDLESKKFIKIGQTLAWNWQQGTQLQWLPPGYDNDLIYNAIVNDKFVSVIYNISSKEKKIIPFPIYAVHPNGKEALGINYERHYWCRPGYNYQNIKNEKWNKPYHAEDGIYKLNLESGECKLIVPIEVVVNNQKLSEFEYCDNWLEHILYNPSGDRFLFFHRWHNGEVDLSRVFIADSSNGDNLFMLPDVRFYSHYCWRSDAELTIWSYEPSSLSQKSIIKNIEKNIKRNKWVRKIIAPIYRNIKRNLTLSTKQSYDNGSKLISFFDKNGRYEIIGKDLLRGNGHQSWFRGGKLLLTDTYQDSDSFRHLLIYDSETEKIHVIGKFYSSFNDCIYRSDLHPRLSSDNKFITIDSAHHTKRKVMIINKQVI